MSRCWCYWYERKSLRTILDLPEDTLIDMFLLIEHGITIILALRKPWLWFICLHDVLQITIVEIVMVNRFIMSLKFTQYLYDLIFSFKFKHLILIYTRFIISMHSLSHHTYLLLLRFYQKLYPNACFPSCPLTEYERLTPTSWYGK